MQPQTREPRSLAGRIGSARELDTRISRIESGLSALVSDTRTVRKRSHRLRNGLMASLFGLVLATAVAVAAITTPTTNFSAAKSDVFVYDESKFTIVSQGMDITASAVSASGNGQGSAIEMATTLGAANSALSAGDWFYEIDVQEAAVGSVASGTYVVELFLDGTSKGALYITQGTANATAIEGVTLKWSLGASLAANGAYVVKVTSA